MTGGTALGILLAHGVGDYLLQSDWMACQKTKRWWPAIAHGLTYMLPYLLITRSPLALLVIAATHIVIDRYRLARHLVWLKNQFAPAKYRWPWADCRATGYPSARPEWLTTWLLIVADNLVHLLINVVAVMWL